MATLRRTSSPKLEVEPSSQADSPLAALATRINFEVGFSTPVDRPGVGQPDISLLVSWHLAGNDSRFVGSCLPLVGASNQLASNCLALR